MFQINKTETYCESYVKVKTEVYTSLTLQVEAPDPTGGGQEQEMVGGDQQVISSLLQEEAAFVCKP